MNNQLTIRGITLERFRKYRSAAADFTSGVNVVRGPNEHGKSTLLSAVLSGLFLNPARRNKQIESLRTWGEEQLPRIAMTFSFGEYTYTLDADIEQKRFQLQRQHTSEPAKHWTTMQEAQQELARITGAMIPDVWLASAVVRHNDIALSSSSAKHARQSLQQALTASESSNTALEAINQLQKEWKTLQKGMDRPTVTPGPLKAVIDERQGLVQHAQLVEQSVVQRGQHEQRLEQLQDELAIQRAQHRNLAPQLEASQGYAAVKKQYDLAQDRLDRIEDVMRQLSELDADTANQFDSIDERLHVLESRKQSLQDELHAQKYPSVPSVLIAEKELDISPSDRIVKGSKLALGLGVAAGASLILALTVSLWVLVVAIPLAIASTVFYVMQTKRAQTQDERHKQQQKELAQESMVQRARQEEQLNKQLEQLNAELIQIQSERVNQASSVAKRETLMAGKTLKEWQEEQKEARRAFVSAEATLEQLGQPLDQSKQVQLKQQLEQTQQIIRAAEKEHIEREAQLGALRYTQEDLVQVNERLFQLKQEQARLELRSDALTEAIQHLQNAQANVTQSAQKAIQTHVGTYMAQITSSKYDQVELSDELDLHIKTRGGWQSSSQVLSQGAQDQLALATRIALMQSMFPTTTPPLFLDDPFGSFDQQRLKATMKLVKALSKDRQVFLFTHSDQYDQWADNVVDVTKIDARAGRSKKAYVQHN